MADQPDGRRPGGPAVTFDHRHYINGVEVREGARFVNLLSTHPILARRIALGALCEGLLPERWRAVIEAEGVIVWQSRETFASLDAADSAARDDYRSSVDRALRELFA